jgi:hypothetical protein
MSTVFALVLALAFPASGLSRGLDAITQCAIRGKTPLERACRAQALAVVIRDPRTLPGDELFADDQHTHADEAKPTITVTEWTQSPAGVSGNSSNTSNHATQPNGAMIDVNQPSEQLKVFGGSSLLPVAASSTQNPEKIREIAPCQTEVREESSAKKTDRTDRGALLKPPGQTTAIASGDLKQSTGTVPQDLEGQQIIGPRLSVVDHKTKTTTRTDSQEGTLKTVLENPRTYSQDFDHIYGPHPDTYRWRFLPTRHWYSLGGFQIHAACNLPKGYALCLIPSDFPIPSVIEDKSNTSKSTSKNTDHIDGISMSYSLTKGVISVFQTVYASFTLYQTRGDQITHYGYAAFGLTVTPYLVMSLMNLVSNILTPDFPLIYLVRDHIMDEIEAKSGQRFERVVAQLKKQRTTNHNSTVGELDSSPFNVPDEVSDMFEGREVVSVTKFISNSKNRRRRHEVWMFCPTIIFSALPLTVMGALTRFEVGHSTHAQWCWFMLWRVFGIYMGLYFKFAEAVTGHSFYSSQSKYYYRGFVGTTYIMWAVPAVGGFIVVGKMLTSYGSCKAL